MSHLNTMNSLQLHHLLIGIRQGAIQSLGASLHEDSDTVSNQGADRECYQDCNEDRADWVSNHPAKELHEDGADDDTNTSQSVGQDVEEDSLHDLTAFSIFLSSMAMSMIMTMSVSISSMTVSMTPSCSSMLKNKDPHQVNQEPQNRHNKQPLVLHLWRFH